MWELWPLICLVFQSGSSLAYSLLLLGLCFLAFSLCFVGWLNIQSVVSLLAWTALRNDKTNESDDKQSSILGSLRHLHTIGSSGLGNLRMTRNEGSE